MVKFVGVQVNRDRAAGTITLTQTRYIEQLADEYKGKFRIRSSPYGETKEERSAFDHLTPASPDEIPLTKTSYLSLLGKIVWPSTMTRVDCSEAVSVLCSMWPPSQRHYDLGLDVIGYLVNTKHMGITFGGRLRIPFLWDQHFIRKKHLINLGRLKNQREGINTLNDPAAKRPLSLDPDLRDRNTTAHLRATSAPIERRV